MKGKKLKAAVTYPVNVGGYATRSEAELTAQTMIKLT